ncbi:unnamed protein product [Alternaria burnsii]|nr:unnamed protein product [Alternaria burnsii]
MSYALSSHLCDTNLLVEKLSHIPSYTQRVNLRELELPAACNFSNRATSRHPLFRFAPKPLQDREDSNHPLYIQRFQPDHTIQLRKPLRTPRSPFEVFSRHHGRQEAHPLRTRHSPGPQGDKRTKTKGSPTIKEDDAAFAPQPDVFEISEAVVSVEASVEAEKAIVPFASTTEPNTKEKHEDDVDWPDDECETVDDGEAAKKTFPESEAASEYDIEFITGDEADITLVGSEDDIEQVEIEKPVREEPLLCNKLSAEIAKPVLKFTKNAVDREKKVAEKDDSDTKVKVATGAFKEKKKSEEDQAIKRQESNDAYSAEGRNIIFKGIETSLQFADLAMWVGLAAVGTTETRHITVDGVTIQVTVKLLEANVNKEIDFADGAGDTVLPTTKTCPQFAVNTAFASKSGETSSTRISHSTTPSIVINKGKLITCRFGVGCKKQATCMFDHSRPPPKKMCSFVNINMGCSKGSRCIYTHEHEGQMCPFGTVRKECPNTFKCSFLHIDDDPPIKKEELSEFQVPYAPVVCEASAADIAERAAINRASREASAAGAPPQNAPTGSKRNKRNRGADDTDTSIQAQHFSPQLSTAYVP